MDVPADTDVRQLVRVALAPQAAPQTEDGLSKRAQKKVRSLAYHSICTPY